MSKKLVGKVAVVTRASQGIGASTGMYEFSPLDGVIEEHFHRHLNVNVLGLLFTTKEAVKHMGLRAAASSTSARSRARCGS